MASCTMGERTANSPSLTADCIRRLYPAVDENVTPLPRQWSTKDKSSILGLSQNNLMVHYKGTAKNHKDAASVRTTHPIPASCGVYYFEVKVVSKGRDGYMGIGLSSKSVSVSRLPGWDKCSYGYHGDDGNSFCSSGPAQPYGTTFTTGDVIGCCLNLVDNICFYTKNGVNLGVAFRDLPSKLYPTIGLQTPGEVVEANFGQSQFVYDIENYIQECRQKTRDAVENFNVCNRTGEWQLALQSIVSTYLVHHGYCAAADAFLRSTGQSCEEELASIQNRQKVQSLVLDGRLGEAITTTQQFYPDLLENNLELLFVLRCRQFIEIVNGTAGESVPVDCSLPSVRRPIRVQAASLPDCVADSSMATLSTGSPAASYRPCDSSGHRLTTSSPMLLTTDRDRLTNGAPLNLSASSADKNIVAQNGETHSANDGDILAEQDSDMDTSDNDEVTLANGSGVQCCMNGSSQLLKYDNLTTAFDSDDGDDDRDDGVDLETVMDIDMKQSVMKTPTDTITDDSLSRLGQQLCGGSETAVRQLLVFGRYLHQLSLRLVTEQTSHTDVRRRMLRDAFSLLAYSDPWNSPVGYQLAAVQREPVCMALNSAILELQGLPKQPPLELAVAHARQCVQHMSKANIASCAFTNISDYL